MVEIDMAGLIPEADRKELDAALANVRDAINGDSNDEEIVALQEALDIALGILGIENPETSEPDWLFRLDRGNQIRPVS